MDSDKYVFISYSRYDSAFVDKLSVDLRQQGVQVWIDRESISPGDKWQGEIERGLKSASALIFVISKHSLKSKWMITELESFFSQNKKVIPARIEDVDISDLPAFIANIQWADFRYDYQSGLDSLFKGLGVQPTALATPASAKQKKTKGYAFLSYAEEDGDFVGKLKEFLKEHGYAYWDYEESDRDYQSQLFLELEGVIIEASTTLSILSEAWKRSHWTVKEYFFSEEVGTPVFLLRAKEIGPTLAIAGMPYIDFTKDNEAGFSKLHKELKRKKL